MESAVLDELTELQTRPSQDPDMPLVEGTAAGDTEANAGSAGVRKKLPRPGQGNHSRVPRPATISPAARATATRNSRRSRAGAGGRRCSSLTKSCSSRSMSALPRKFL